VAKSLEFAQLMRAIDPQTPILIAAPDLASPAFAAPVVHALEWCLARDASVVFAFPSRPPFTPPYDRVLYGAFDVARRCEPVEARFIPRGRAHHGSAIEQRIEAAILADAELAPLFSCNEVAPIRGHAAPPRVDLLWREGRVVVELDGPDHQDAPKFANDRHRDYELLVSGYLVLRITNAEAATDLQRAVEKIRDVVRFRQAMEKGAAWPNR
jgi:hypothetical protein